MALPKCDIGIIGGTGVYQMVGLEDIQEHKIDTPFGEPSGVYSGRLHGEQVAFIARHGKGHRLLPSEVPFKANIFALKKLGVKYLFTVSACGSLKIDHHPGDLVVVDQFIDRTKSRDATYFGNGIVGHVMFGEPTCQKFRALAYEAIKKSLPDCAVHNGGTYICMEGPCFSTKAESLMYQQLGGSVIGMTALTEAKLAREAEMAYCLIGLVTDYDAWHPEEGHVDAEAVMKVLASNGSKAQTFIGEVVKSLSGNKFESDAHSCLKLSLLTKAEAIDNETKKSLEPLFGKYYPPQ